MNTWNSLAEKPPVVKLAFGIVVFRMQVKATMAFQSLVDAIEKNGNSDHFTIYVYDNTDDPFFKPDPLGVEGVVYFHNPGNPGISVAYNHMAKMARQDGHEWMVFLDQDTKLPGAAVQHYLQAIVSQPDLQIKCPVLVVDNYQFSPTLFQNMRSSVIERFNPGIYPLQKMTIANSGMLVHLPLFFEVGGYDEKLRIDFTDTAFIEKVKRKTPTFEVLPFDCLHDFSDKGSNSQAAISRFMLYATDLSNYPVANAKERIQLLLVGTRHAIKLCWRHRSLRFLAIFFTNAIWR
jgi:GT2 family glycosyltransferase